MNSKSLGQSFSLESRFPNIGFSVVMATIIFINVKNHKCFPLATEMLSNQDLGCLFSGNGLLY